MGIGMRSGWRTEPIILTSTMIYGPFFLMVPGPGSAMLHQERNIRDEETPPYNNFCFVSYGLFTGSECLLHCTILSDARRGRSAERCVGKECVSTGKYRRALYD